MKDLRPVIEKCRHCGIPPESEIWRPGDLHVQETVEEGVEVKTSKAEIPDWAMPYALQGIGRVTRYWCAKCGEEIVLSDS